MSSRWKKIWADFWNNKSRTFLVIITIAVGVLAVGFNSNLGQYMNESMDADYLSASPSEATIYAWPLDDAMVKTAREVPGVDAVEGRSSMSGKVIRTDEKKVFIQFTAMEDPSQTTVNQLKPAYGMTSLPAFGEKEIIVDASAQALGYKPGDKITVELGDGKLRELTLAGYMHDVTGFPFSFSQTMNAYVTPKTLEWLGGSGEYYDSLLISVAEKQTDQNHVTAIAQTVSDRIERAGGTVYFVNVYQPGHHFAYSISQGIFFILTVLGYMTVFLSSFLIINTVTSLMSQQTRQIGIMKAIGGANSEVFVMYVVLILVFGLAAFAIAVPVGNSAASTFGAGMGQYLNFYPFPYAGYPSAYIQQAIVALVIPVLAALWPIYNSVRVTVREAISDYGIGGNAKPKNKPISKSALFLTRPMRLSLRNVFRKKTRLALTLITLVLAGGIFIGVYNLWESFDKTIEDIQGYFLADINMSFGRYYRYEEVASMAESIPGVSSVEGWTEYTGTLISDKDGAGTQVVFMAPPSTSTLIDPVITSGRWLVTGDENAIVIGNHLLNIYPDLKIGDWLTIKIDDKETKWQIVGTYSITGNTNVPLLYVNYEYLSKLVGAPGQVYSLRVLTEQNDVISQRRISDQLQRLYESHGIGVNQTQLGAEFVRDQKAQTDILVYFMLGMTVMIAVVGGLGLMGTMSINVLERTREIGVMRAVGASNTDIQGIVIIEGMVVGLIAWVISIVFSIPITSILCFGVGMAILTAPMPAVFGVTGVIAWLIVTVVLTTIASALPARRASRLTVRDTLAYE